MVDFLPFLLLSTAACSFAIASFSSDDNSALGGSGAGGGGGNTGGFGFKNPIIK
jgi:hypothetical protein